LRGGGKNKPPPKIRDKSAEGLLFYYDGCGGMKIPTKIIGGTR